MTIYTILVGIILLVASPYIALLTLTLIWWAAYLIRYGLTEGNKRYKESVMY